MKIKISWSAVRYSDEHLPEGETNNGYFHVNFPIENVPDEMEFTWDITEHAIEQKREPLTDAQIDEASKNIRGIHCSIVHEIARAIEAAHGITKE